MGILDSHNCRNCANPISSKISHWRTAKYCSRACWKTHWKGKNTHMWGLRGEKHWSTGRKLPEELKARIRATCKAKALRGALSPMWVADRSKLAKANEQRFDTSHREWSRTVKMRDKWQCRIKNQDCEGRLEAHHILSYAEYPELRYTINNGITLCHAHHPRGRAEEKRLVAEFQALVSVSKV